MPSLYIFNPENDLALANGSRNYYPPPSARKIARDLALLPMWYAEENSYVVIPETTERGFIDDIEKQFAIKSRILYPRDMSKDISFTECIPWGWSPYIVKHLTDMGADAEIMPSAAAIAQFRELSNRRTATIILSLLSQRGIHVPRPVPYYTDSLEEAMNFVAATPRSVLKAPWSGSGHGLVWGRGIYERSVEQLSRGIINRQGGIVCEKSLDKVLDFAMEFISDKGQIRFAGYSLFCTDEKGVYKGNLLATDNYIENILCRYVKQEELSALRQIMPEILDKLLGVKYLGLLGIDMMIYDDGGTYRIAPCVELNLRMSMGALARIFYDRYILRGELGRFDIFYFDNPEDAVSFCKNIGDKYPAAVKDGKLVSGAMPLAPVNNKTNYVAMVRCGLAGSELSEFSV